MRCCCCSLGSSPMPSIPTPRKPETQTELFPLNVIRVETALSRFPVHRLSKRGNIAIEIREEKEDGEVLIQWEVSHNSRFGQPGPLAYKVDTLIINRRIEESSWPIPEIIKLGSLHDICRKLGISGGKPRENVKNALYQNAGAFITAKVRYRQSDGNVRSIEIAGTRYNLVFTGEKLPNGETAH